MSQKENQAFEQRFREAFANLGAMAESEPQERNEAPPTKRRADVDRLLDDFRLKPREVRAYLDRFVVGQDQAKRVLAVAVCDHYNQVRRCRRKPERVEAEYAKHNVLMLGPTGVGKTYLVRCLARLVGVPFVKADATKFSETGYVGHDVEDLVRDLVRVADGDAELAQYGIIYLDEVDKIAARNGSGTRDVSGRGVQVNLLKLMEASDVGLFSQTDLIGQVQAVMDMQRGKAPSARTLNTRHILFIASGAFGELPEIVRRRVGSSAIGFGSALATSADETHMLRLAETDDFVKFGFEPEFIGRLPVRVACDALSEEDLLQILTEAENSILEQYREDFEGYGITLGVEESALREIARRAYREQTGARGLMTVMERLLRPFKYDLPSLPVEQWVLDEQVVADPANALRELSRAAARARESETDKAVKAWLEALQQQAGVEVVFTDAALRLLREQCASADEAPREWLESRYRDVPYGLQLWRETTRKNHFRATARFVRDPDRELSGLIKRELGTH